MRRQLCQLWALTGLALRESMRQPALLLITTAVSTLGALFPLVLAHQFGEPGKLVRDSVLGLQLFFGVVIGGLASATAIGREMETGTGLLVLSKSVSRSAFFLAKFVGVAVVLLLFSWCVGFAAALSTRVGPANYVDDPLAGRIVIGAVIMAYAAAAVANAVWRRPFCSTALLLLCLFLPLSFALIEWCRAMTHGYPVYEAVRLVPAVVLILLALLLMAAIALLLATRLSAVPVLAVCALVFATGLLSDHLLGARIARSGLAAALYAVIPNWQSFWMADALSRNGSIAVGYVVRSGAYAAAHVCAWLCFGLWAFRSGEVR